MISIIIVNYNWKKRLKKCFDSLRLQTYRNFEIIMVDNASSDDSLLYTKTNYPEVKIIQSDKNLWFAWGNNLAISYMQWDFILFLNNDTYLDFDLLENCIKIFDNKKIGVIQPKLVYMDNHAKIDNLWWFFTNTWFLYYWWNDKRSDLALYCQSKKVFTVKWACMFTRKSIIDKIWLFDDDFRSYYEETDFCHRVVNLWYECWYIPVATCYHFNWWTSKTQFSNDFIQFHNFKNKLCSFLKNFDSITLLKFLPLYLVLNIFISILWLLKWKYGHVLAIYKAIRRNITHFKNTLNKRKYIFSFKTKSDIVLLKEIYINPKFNYYLKLFNWSLNFYED